MNPAPKARARVLASRRSVHAPKETALCATLTGGFDMPTLVLLMTLCTGVSSTTHDTHGTAYLTCQPEVGAAAYCPNEPDAKEADCVVTSVAKLHGGRSIVAWEHTSPASGAK